MRTTHLVVARYNEPLEWVRPVHCNLAQRRTLDTFIYNKGEFVPMGHTMGVGDASPWPRIVELPNVNRDGGTLLSHLKFINEHNQVPDEVIFLQGDPAPHLPSGVMDIRNPQFLPYYLTGWDRDSYVYLNGVLECDLNGRPHHTWDLYLSRVWFTVQRIAYGHGMDFKNLPEKIIFSPGMSQIIPRISMTAPSNFWLDMTMWMNEHEDRGWQIERLWPEIFKNIRKHNEQ